MPRNQSWILIVTTTLADKAPASIAQAVESLIETSVRERLISDVPLATFCSGGIDSSLITALAAKQ